MAESSRPTPPPPLDDDPLAGAFPLKRNLPAFLFSTAFHAVVLLLLATFSIAVVKRDRINVKIDPADLPHWVALREHCGIDTLDLPVEVMAAALVIDVSALAPFRIRGFLREGRSFGGATAFAATIARIDAPETRLECAILVPDLTQHVDVIEVISTVKLRDALPVVDGDAVSLSC